MKNPKIDNKGNKEWRNSKGDLHRINGPAFIWTDGTKEWWIDGVEYTKRQFDKKVKEYK